MRGTVSFGFVLDSDSRITPACAGNSAFSLRGNRIMGDHPRVCGEQMGWVPKVMEVPGSPPRVRGTDKPTQLAFAHKRITPACAGNSFPSTEPVSPLQDHPRVCGEQPFLHPQPLRRPGSPPRVRGTATPSKVFNATLRITPACAGNSHGFQALLPPTQDHPRVCGEQS